MASSARFFRCAKSRTLKLRLLFGNKQIFQNKFLTMFGCDFAQLCGPGKLGIWFHVKIMPFHSALTLFQNNWPSSFFWAKFSKWEPVIEQYQGLYYVLTISMQTIEFYYFFYFLRHILCDSAHCKHFKRRLKKLSIMHAFFKFFFQNFLSNNKNIPVHLQNVLNKIDVNNFKNKFEPKCSHMNVF